MQSGEIHIQERFFRHIWCNQYLRTGELTTSDGTKVRVSDPGRLNVLGGPDVRDAVIMIGDITFVGDVEIHRAADDWWRHGHNTDPAYNRVILHVVMRKTITPRETFTASGRRVPLLALESFLQEPLRSLLHRIAQDEASRVSDDIPCRSGNTIIGAAFLRRWINRLAAERLELKIQRFRRRLWELATDPERMVHEPQRGYKEPQIEGFPEEIPSPEPVLPTGAFSRRGLWDQILYEGFMDGLGYSRNRRPFLRLAEIANLGRIRDLGIADDPLRLASLLFGVSGLLPPSKALRTSEAARYARKLRREWNSIQRMARFEQLHSADWYFFPSRPGNFPTIRIAAASVFIHHIMIYDLFRRIIRTMIECTKPQATHSALRSLLRITPDPFWVHHYHFSRPRAKAGSVIGVRRLDDLIANTLLPISFLYARMFHDRRVREGSLALYEHFPPLLSNSILRTMERQLLLGKVPLDSMKVQQGVIQLHTSYCRQGRCNECDVGRMVF